MEYLLVGHFHYCFLLDFKAHKSFLLGCVFSNLIKDKVKTLLTHTHMLQRLADLKMFWTCGILMCYLLYRVSTKVGFWLQYY